MSRMTLVWAGAFLLALQAGAGAATAQNGGAADSVVLRPGDAVQITVWRQPELSGEFTLAADGTIDHPLYQQVEVAGMPLSEARGRLHQFLAGWEAEPRFLLKPLFRVAVGGEVQRPNLYTFPPEMTIQQAVASAGGVTERGRLDRVRVIRARGEDIRVDLTSADIADAHLAVRSGDQIIVERTRMVTFRDYVAPAGTIAMAAVSLLSILLR